LDETELHHIRAEDAVAVLESLVLQDTADGSQLVAVPGIQQVETSRREVEVAPSVAWRTEVERSRLAEVVHIVDTSEHAAPGGLGSQCADHHQEEVHSDSPAADDAGQTWILEVGLPICVV
jgi:hypothetical protein